MLPEVIWKAALPRLAGIEAELRWSRAEAASGFSGVGTQLFAQMVWLKLQGAEASGFGITSSRYGAATKAFMEALESVALADARSPRGHRSGIAAHFDQRKAQECAYRELVERDALLFHWLCEIPGRMMGVPGSHAGRMVELESVDTGIRVVLAGGPSEHGCWYIGLGSAEKLDLAAEKARSESIAARHLHDSMGGCPVLQASQVGGFMAASGRHHLATREPRVQRLLELIFSGSLRGELSLALPEPRRGARFISLPARSKRYFVIEAAHEALLPLEFGDIYEASRAKYLANNRVGAHLPLRFSFHEPSKFLPHPFD